MAKANISQNPVTAYFKQIVGSRKDQKIPLYDFDMVVGRAKKADIVSTDPNVSRTHCFLKYSSSGWSIKDLGSVNGTYVNDTRISKNSYIPLTHGDKIYFGLPSEAPEGYMFECVKTSESSSEDNPLRKVLRSKTPSPQKPATKRKVSPTRALTHDGDKVTVHVRVDASRGTLDSQGTDQQHIEECYHSDSSASSYESLRTRIKRENHKKQKRRRVTNIDENAAFPSTSSVRQPHLKNFNFNGIVFLGGKSDDEGSESLLHQQDSDNLNVDCKDIKIISTKNNFDSSTKLSDLDSHTINDLKKEISDLKHTLLMTKLRLTNVVEEKSNLEEAMKNKEKSELDLKVKTEFMREDFKKLLEDELICNICTELFIKPIILGCSHTFCKHCIWEWKKKKKQCPICRERIEVENQVLFMDDFVNKAVKLLDPASLEKRMELAKQREEMQKKKPPKRKKCKSRNTGRRRNAISGPSGRRDTSEEVEILDLGRRVNEAHTYHDDIQAYVDVIDNLIHEDDSDVIREDDYDDDDILDYMDLHDHRGPCYNCGRSGHWAEDCPYDD